MRFDRPTFLSLIVGHLVFLVVTVAIGPLFGYLVTPAFVLPMLIVRRRSGAVGREIIVFAVLMTGVHFLAVQQAMSIEMPMGTVWPDLPHNWVAGGAGGLIGSAATFALIALFRLASFDRRTLAMMSGGTVLLTLLGAAGVAVGLAAAEYQEELVWNLIVCVFIYTPWQIAFAAILALILRPARPLVGEPAHV